MISQDGKLVLILKGHRGEDDVAAGTYFLIRQSNEVLRFGFTRGILEMNLLAEDWDRTLDIAVFKRRGRTNNDIKGTRRRDLIDITSFPLGKLQPAEVVQNVARWTKLEARLPKANICIHLDVEFYASNAPLKPNRVKPFVDVESESRRYCTKKTPIANVRKEPIDQKNKIVVNEVPKFFPRLHLKRKNRKTDTISNTDIIYDDFIKFGETRNEGPTEKYVHGVKNVNIHTEDTSDVYEFIRSSKEMNYDIDTLPIENEPIKLLKAKSNRLMVGEKVQFGRFSTANIRFTGYIGNGRWCKPQVGFFNMSAYIFSRPSLPSPTLPPKCPKGMLWEEYYILEKEKYIKDVTSK